MRLSTWERKSKTRIAERMKPRRFFSITALHSLLFLFDSLKELIQKRDDYKTDLEQFYDLIQQMDQHVAVLCQKRDDRTKELQDTKVRLAEITERVKKLKETINQQELSLEDVRKMKNDLKGVEEATERALSLKDQRRSSLWEIESEMEKMWADVENLVSDYNTNFGELHLLHLFFSKKVDMKATLNKNAAQDNDQAKLLAIDLDVVQSNLSSMCDEYARMSSEWKQRYQHVLDELELSEEAFTEAMEKHRIVDGKIDKCEETMEAEREAQDAKLAVRLREAETIESKVASLRDPVALEEQMTQLERQCTDLEALRQQYKEENLARKQSVCEEINQACFAIEDYNRFCAETVEDVIKYRTEKRASYEMLRPPHAIQDK